MVLWPCVGLVIGQGLEGLPCWPRARPFNSGIEREPRSLADDLLIYATGAAHATRVQAAYQATFGYLHTLGAEVSAAKCYLFSSCPTTRDIFRQKFGSIFAPKSRSSTQPGIWEDSFVRFGDSWDQPSTSASSEPSRSATALGASPGPGKPRSR